MVTRLAIVMALTATVVGCKQQGVEASESKPASEACFEKLQPGEIEKSEMTSVSYLNGKCRDGYHALNKMSIQSKVYVDVAGDVSERSLSVSDESIYISEDGEKINLGKIVVEEDGSRVIKLEKNIKLDLLIGGNEDDLKVWAVGDNMKKYKVERILLTVE